VDGHGNLTSSGAAAPDTSAVALAAALKAHECHIYTDVAGVYTTDPRLGAEARRLRHITFEEMIEMAGAGSKVLQIRAGSSPASTEFRRACFSASPPGAAGRRGGAVGTLITFEEDPHMAMEKAVISGVAFNRDEAKITVHDVSRPPRHRVRHPRPDRRLEHRRRRHRAEHRPRRNDRPVVHGHRSDYAKAMSS